MLSSYIYTVVPCILHHNHITIAESFLKELCPLFAAFHFYNHWLLWSRVGRFLLFSDTNTRPAGPASSWTCAILADGFRKYMSITLFLTWLLSLSQITVYIDQYNMCTHVTWLAWARIPYDEPNWATFCTKTFIYIHI